MKIRTQWLVIPAMALSLGACRKTAPPKVGDPAVETATTTEKAPPPATGPVVKSASLSPDERAAKLGFVKFLPQDTEVVMAFHNGSKAADRVKASKLWKLVESQMVGGRDLVPGGDELEMEKEEFQLPEGEQDGAPVDADPAVLPDADEEVGPAAMLGREVTIALGKTTAEQAANVLTGYRRMNYFQTRTMVKALVSAVKSGDFDSISETMANQYGPELIKDLLADPESGMALVERMKMPPLYLACRAGAAGPSQIEQQLATVTESMASMGDMVEAIEIEKNGKTFAGQKISGKKISEAMAEEREEMEEMMEPKAVDQLLAAIAKNDIVVVSGILGDYGVLFIGSSTDDMKFAASPADSMVGTNTLAFCDAYAAKDLAFVMYGEKAASDKLIAAAGGLSDMAVGLRDGLAGSEGLGDTRDLEALLRMVAERETALRKLAGTENLGVAAFFEDGLKIETHGGTDSGAIDWKSPNQLASLGDSEEVVMFANMTTEASYDEKSHAYLEALMETAYAMAMKLAEIKLPDEEMAKYQEMAVMFEKTFRKDAVDMWDAFSDDFGGSIGRESAMIVDLNGSVPAIPGIPQQVVDQGKFPRITMLSPVTDRAKLATSWEKMNTSTTNILAKISEMTQQEIPMQKPISSDKNGYTTWFFSMPFFNDDFMPSVTVGDKWFAASTSKNQALDLIDRASKGGESRTGLYFKMNFQALQKFSRETLKMFEKNSKAIVGEDGPDPSDLKNIGDLIGAMDDLDNLTVHSRREGGELRTSIHFKTR